MLFSVVTLSLFLCLSFSSISHGKPTSIEIPLGKYTYQERVGEKIIPFYWEVEKNSAFNIVSVYEEHKSFYNKCAIDGATLQWKMKVDDKHDIMAERKGNTLTISGTRFGQSYNKVVKIDERPWYQSLSFSLQSFLASEQDGISFWVIRVDKIEPIVLKVEKMGEDVILFNNTPVPTQKLEVRAKGIYSPFWHGTYWYRKSDRLFMRYQSVHGPPGTEETVVELAKEPNH